MSKAKKITPFVADMKVMTGYLNTTEIKCTFTCIVSDLVSRAEMKIVDKQCTTYKNIQSG